MRESYDHGVYTPARGHSKANKALRLEYARNDAIAIIMVGKENVMQRAP